MEEHRSGHRHDISLVSLPHYPSTASSIPCDNNKTPITVRIHLKLDTFVAETSWNVTNIRTNQAVSEGGSYTAVNDAGVLKTTIFSVCPQDCFRFTIYDSYGDGLNDDNNGSPGSYEVVYSEHLVQEGGGNFGEGDYIPGCETVPYGKVNYCVAREFQPSGSPSRLPTVEPSRSPTLTMVRFVDLYRPDAFAFIHTVRICMHNTASYVHNTYTLRPATSQSEFTYATFYIPTGSRSILGVDATR